MSNRSVVLALCAATLATVPGATRGQDAGRTAGDELTFHAALLHLDAKQDFFADNEIGTQLRYPSAGAGALQLLDVTGRRQSAIAYRAEDVARSPVGARPVYVHPAPPDGSGGGLLSVERNAPSVRAFYGDDSVLLTDSAGSWWRWRHPDRRVQPRVENAAIRGFHADPGGPVEGHARTVFLGDRKVPACAGSEVLSISVAEDAVAVGSVSADGRRTVCLLDRGDPRPCRCDDVPPAEPAGGGCPEPEEPSEPKLSSDSRFLAVAHRSATGGHSLRVAAIDEELRPGWLRIREAGGGERSSCTVRGLQVHGVRFSHDTFFFDGSYRWHANQLFFLGGDRESGRRLRRLVCDRAKGCREDAPVRLPACVTVPPAIDRVDEQELHGRVAAGERFVRFWLPGDNGCDAQASPEMARLRLSDVSWVLPVVAGDGTGLLFVEMLVKLQTTFSQGTWLRRIVAFRLPEAWL